MAILQTENTINPISTSAQLASASAYSSDPSADPQFLDISGGNAVDNPEAGEGVLVGTALSAATIASIENQVGVKAVYATNAAGQADPAVGVNLYDSNGNLIQEDDPRMLEYNKLINSACAQQRASNPNLQSLQAAASSNLDDITSVADTSMANALISIMQPNASSTKAASTS
jgi:hypothetical protein